MSSHRHHKPQANFIHTSDRIQLYISFIQHKQIMKQYIAWSLVDLTHELALKTLIQSKLSKMNQPQT